MRTAQQWRTYISSLHYCNIINWRERGGTVELADLIPHFP